MKKFRKIACILASSMILSGAAFAEENHVITADVSDALNSGFSGFAKALNSSAPNAAMQQNVWSDAYLGTIFPGLKFGFGSTTGVSSFDISGLGEAINALDTESSGESGLPKSLVLPVITADVRLGGIIFPFDVGFSIGMLKPSGSGFDFKNPSSVYNMSDSVNFNFGETTLGINYLALGFDVRYCLYDGLFKFSVGGGYYHYSATVGVGMTNSGSTTVSEGGNDYTANYDVNANMGLSFKTDVLTAQCQISKSFVVATVFAGGRLSISTTKTSWGLNVDGTAYAAGISKSESISESAGNTYSSGNMFRSFKPTVYAGASLNLLVFQFTANVGTDLSSIIPAIRDKNFAEFNWTGALSFHVKL